MSAENPFWFTHVAIKNYRGSLLRRHFFPELSCLGGMPVAATRRAGAGLGRPFVGMGFDEIPGRRCCENAFLVGLGDHVPAAMLVQRAVVQFGPGPAAASRQPRSTRARAFRDKSACQGVQDFLGLAWPHSMLCLWLCAATAVFPLAVELRT